MTFSDIVVISDPGLSGKDLNPPGLQQLLQMVDDGQVSNVLTWRLDRLSRNLADLILLADRFGQAEVGMHSFTEKLDLSSATGRMFYNILGSFAQFFREQLSENVRMGMAQAMRQGRWVNRPPTGYDLVDGLLVPNNDAPKVRRVFRMRADGSSQTQISEVTGINYSTVLSILKNRAYLGEIRHLDEWSPGLHEGLVSLEEFEAAHRGRVPGRKRGRDLMSGRVLCGLCGRRMSIMTNGKGQSHYRCKHRGSGCKQPARSNRGLLAAAGLGMSLLCDTELREAIRAHLESARAVTPQGRRRAVAGPTQGQRNAFVPCTDNVASSCISTMTTRSPLTSSARNKPASHSRSTTSRLTPTPASMNRSRPMTSPPSSSNSQSSSTRSTSASSGTPPPTPRSGSSWTN